jgi:replication-associated recombination protein RarA
MNWRPRLAEDLIGQAKRVATAQVAKARRLSCDPSATMKLLLYGPPGVGKTSVVELVAMQLAGTALAIEDYNGRQVTVDVVRQWMTQLPYGSLFAPWSVKIVNELDLLTERFQTRFQAIKLLPPSTEEQAEFLSTRWRTWNPTWTSNPEP